MPFHFDSYFSPFSIAITSLGEERANLSAFRTFVRFVLDWICRFPLPLGVWEGLRFVIVALPGLFSYSYDLVYEYEWVRFFKGQVYDWGRFRNTCSSTRTTITPKLHHRPAPLPHETHTRLACRLLNLSRENCY